MPHISIITPTGNREAMLSKIWDCVRNQDEKDFEWLILDTGKKRAGMFDTVCDSRVTYLYRRDDNMTIGAKRNELCAMAKGDIIAMFDDDDHYARGYLTSMLALMDSQKYDFVKLFGFYLFHPASDRFGYWDLTWDAPQHFAIPPLQGKDVYEKRGDRDTRWGFGFTYVFRKHVWDALKYPDENYQEDHWFVTDVRKRFKAGGMQDEVGLCLHILHGGNTTSNFPQRLIHPEELERLFPDYKP